MLVEAPTKGQGPRGTVYFQAMRVAIMAAGGVGGYFGGRLQAAGHEVVFFARGAHRDAMRMRGLRIESPLGNLELPEVEVSDDPESVAPADIVLFAVKLWDTEAAGELVRPVITRDTRVITVQNGVDSVERLAPILGAGVVVGGTAFISSVIKEPGVIGHVSNFARLRCGWLDGRNDERVSSFVAAAKAAGIEIVESPTMQLDRWTKFVFLVALSGATGLTRMPIGAVLADADTRALARGIVEETIAVGRAIGVAFPEGCADERFHALETLPPATKASMLYDLERGNRLELDWLSGHVVELGRVHGVATPMNSAVYTALKLHRLGSHPGEA